MASSTVFDGEQGLALARETIDRLAQLALSASPPNYELWATYLSGANPTLRTEIDRRLVQGETAAAISEELFERHFGSTKLAVEIMQASESIARELSEVAQSLRGAGDETTRYAGVLDEAVQTFESGADARAMRRVLGQLAAATRDMVVKNGELSAQIDASSRQVESLQSTLHTVKLEALTDGLSGLANRKHFDEVLRREIERSPGEVALPFIDIDHFKRFNDTWGHLVGDQVLRFIAQVLRAHASGDRRAARYGGEEFALIMPRTALDGARTMGEAINRAVKAKQLTRRSTGEKLGALTVSIGIARHCAGESATDLIGRADAQLYISKREGRDRVTIDLREMEPLRLRA